MQMLRKSESFSTLIDSQSERLLKLFIRVIGRETKLIEADGHETKNEYELSYYTNQVCAVGSLPCVGV